MNEEETDVNSEINDEDDDSRFMSLVHKVYMQAVGDGQSREKDVFALPSLHTILLPFCWYLLIIALFSLFWDEF